MPVLAIGVSHHQTTTDELTAFSQQLSAATGAIAGLEGVNGLITVATCNRCEVYLDVDKLHHSVRQIRDVLVAQESTELAGRIDVRTGCTAVTHLFEVSCGLDSMVIGENEIVGQVRAALIGTPHSSPMLHRLFQAALSCSKRISAGTTLRSLGRSVASIGIDLAEHRHGPVKDHEVLILGTGSYAGVVTADLQRRGAKVIVHSVSGRAIAFTRSHPGTQVSAEDLDDALHSCNLVVCCSGTGVRTITPELVRRVTQRRNDELVIVDLALGRDVDPVIAGIDGARLIDLDDIAAHVPEGQVEAERTAHHMVTEAVKEHMINERTREADPAIRALRDQMNHLVEREMAHIAAHTDPATADTVSRTLHRVTNAWLHTPTAQAGKAAREDRIEEFTRAIELAFGLDIKR